MKKITINEKIARLIFPICLLLGILTAPIHPKELDFSEFFPIFIGIALIVQGIWGIKSNYYCVTRYLIIKGKKARNVSIISLLLGLWITIVIASFVINSLVVSRQFYQ